MKIQLDVQYRAHGREMDHYYFALLEDAIGMMHDLLILDYVLGVQLSVDKRDSLSL